MAHATRKTQALAIDQIDQTCHKTGFSDVLTTPQTLGLQQPVIFYYQLPATAPPVGRCVRIVATCIVSSRHSSCTKFYPSRLLRSRRFSHLLAMYIPWLITLTHARMPALSIPPSLRLSVSLTHTHSLSRVRARAARSLSLSRLLASSCALARVLSGSLPLTLAHKQEVKRDEPQDLAGAVQPTLSHDEQVL